MSKNRVQLNSVVSSQLPQYVQEDYPLVSSFLKQYYLGQEYQSGPVDLIQNIDEYIKLDETTNVVESVILQGDLSFYDKTIKVDPSESPTGTIGFPDSYGLLKIDNEIITYTGKTDYSFTGCRRGFVGITSYKSNTNNNELIFEESEYDDHTAGSTIENLSILFLKQFLLKTKNQLLPGLENRTLTEDLNQNIFIKQSKDFYLSKGTDQSYKILFKALYNKDVSVIRPSEFLVTPSNARYEIVNQLVVEPISGDPENLDTATFYQDAYKFDKDINRAYAPITSVEKIEVGYGQTFYKLNYDGGYNRDIGVDGVEYGQFQVEPSTKVIGAVSSGATIFDVDSTVGFGTTGELYVTYNDTTTGVVSYTSKSLTQFFGVTNLSGIIDDATIVGINTFSYGRSKLNQDEIIKVRVSSVYNSVKLPKNTNSFVKGTTANVTTYGISENNFKTDKWEYNVSPHYGVDKVELVDKSDFTYAITLKSKHYLKIGNSIFVVLKDKTKVSSTIISIDNEKSCKIRGQGSLENSQVSSIQRKIQKGSSNTFPNITSFSTGVDNLYKNDDGEYIVASPSIPSYNSQPIEVTPRKVTFSGTFIGTELEITPGIEHGFYTGDAVYYAASTSDEKYVDSSGTVRTRQKRNTGLFNDGLYFISRVDGFTLKFAKSRDDINNGNFIDVESSTTVSDSIIQPYTSFEKTLKPQKLLRKIIDPKSQGVKSKTLPGTTGILINGVEVLNYKSEDVVRYGAIESIDILSPSNNIDVINPPNLIISDTVGAGATGHIAVSGSLREIRVLDGGFDYLSTPTLKIDGGNGAGAFGTVNMKMIDNSPEFFADEASAKVSLTNNTIGFATYHKFRNTEQVIYKTFDEECVVGLDTSALYFISVSDNVSVKLHPTQADALSGINTVNLTGFGIGKHALQSVNKKSIVSSVNIVNGGSDYETKKRTAHVTGINTSSNVITIKNHGYQNGEKIKYTVVGSVAEGLTNNTEYYVTSRDTDSFRLSAVGVSSDKEFYYRTKQYEDIKSVGLGTHVFNYPDITATLIGEVGISSVGTETFKASVQPIVRGQISSVHVENNGVGYGSSEILNYDRQPTITISSGKNAQVKPVISNGRIIQVIVLNSGTGYKSTPDLRIAGVGVGAVLIPIIVNESLSEIRVLEPGGGYDKSDTTITVETNSETENQPAFYSNLKTWRVNIFEKNTPFFTKDDGVVSPSNYELQYFHLYPPRVLRESTYSVNSEGDVLYGESDLRKVSSIEVDSDQHSPILGFAYDGNPIYGPYGYTTKTGGAVTQLKSGYSLDLKSGRPPLSIYPEGFFVEDYTHTKTTDVSTLDENNGRFGVTPDYPNGTYAYYMTVNDLQTEASGVFEKYKKPVFPYIIGENYYSIPDEFNFNPSSNQDEFDFKTSDLRRNTNPLNLIEETQEYPYLFIPNKFNQTAKINAASPGTIDSIGILTGGNNYKVNETLVFNNSRTSGDSAYARIQKIKGKPVSNISVATSSIGGVEIYPKSSGTYEVVCDNPHEFQNLDVIRITGLSTNASGIEGTYTVGISSNVLRLAGVGTTAVAIGTEGVTGLVTYFSVTGDILNTKVNDVLGIGTEKVKVLNVDFENSRLRVLRSVSGTVSAGHTIGKFLIEDSRNLNINTGITSTYKFTRNEEVYFDPSETVGLGTTAGIGIGSTLSFANPGAGITQKFIPTKTLYFKNHSFKTGDQLTYSTGNGGTGLYVQDETNVGVGTTLASGDKVFVAKVDDDLIGIATIRVGLGTTGTFVGVAASHRGSSTLFFKGVGVGNSHSFTTNHTVITGEIKKNTVTVNTTEAHGISPKHRVDVFVNPRTNNNITVKYNDHNRNVVFNPLGFSSTGINTSTGAINIPDHKFNGGEKVIYNVGIGSDVSEGLINENIYYISRVDDNNFKLSNNYYDATKDIPVTVGVASTGLTGGNINPINPPLSLYKDSTVTFDLSDSSLGYSVLGSNYPAFELNLYRDKDCKISWDKSDDSKIFEYSSLGQVGSAGAESILRVSSNLPESLFYKLDLVYNASLPSIKSEITTDDDVISGSELKIVSSGYNGNHRLIVGSTTSFLYDLSEFPESVSYASTISEIFYETDCTHTEGPIAKIDIINPGRNYYALPGISTLNSVSGDGAILEAQSSTIGSLKSVSIEDIGFNLPSDNTLKPRLLFPQSIRIEPLATLQSVGITSFGRGFSITPKLVVIDGKTKLPVTDVDLKMTLGSSEVKILKNTNGLSNLSPTIIPTLTDSGVGISTIEYFPTTKDALVTLSVGFSTVNSFPFAVGDKVLVENVSVGVGSTGQNYNSSGYDYKLFELTEVSSNLGGIGSVRFNMSNLFEEDEFPGQFDAVNSTARITAQKHFPLFQSSLVLNNYIIGETVDSESATGVVEDWNPITSIVRVSSNDNFIVGEKITGKSSKVVSIASSITSFETYLEYDASSKVVRGWQSDSGELNYNLQRLQDNFYYQKFSYSLKSEVPYDTWNDVVSSTNHTLGYKKFADYQLESTNSNQMSVGLSTELGSVDTVNDLSGFGNLNCVSDFDLVTENNINSGTISDEMIFTNRILTDYFESVGNRVLSIDDISGEFNSEPRLTPFSVVNTFNLSDARALKYVTYVRDKRYTQERQLLIVDLVHDGVKAYMNQYGRIETQYDQGSFDFSITGTDGQLLFYPTKSTINDFNVTTLSYNISGIATVGTGVSYFGSGVLVDTSNTEVTSGSSSTIVSIASTYNSAKVLVSINPDSTQNDKFEMVELNVTHDGTTVELLEFGQLTTGGFDSFSGGAGLGTYSAAISGSNLEIDFHPGVGIATTCLVNTVQVALSENTSGIGTTKLQFAEIDGRTTSISASGTPGVTTVSQYGNDYDSAYFIAQVADTTNGRYQISELVVVDDYLDATNSYDTYFTEYGNIETSIGLGTFGTSIDSTGTVSLLFTPNASIATKVTVFKNAVTLDQDTTLGVAITFSNASIGGEFGTYEGTESDIKRSFGLTHETNEIFERYFTGNDSSVVNVTNNTITIPNHFFVSGEKIEYVHVGTASSAVGIATTSFVGASNTTFLPGENIFAVKVDDNNIKIAASAENALKEVPEIVELESVGIGTSHRFVATNQNAKIMVAIDNLIQAPIVATSVTTGLSTNTTIFENIVKFSGITSFFGSDLIRVGSEIMKIEGVGIGSTNFIKVRRGWLGTKVAAAGTHDLVTKITGNYNVVDNVLNFVEAPFGNTPIGSTTNPPDERDYVGITTSSTFQGRSFIRSGITGGSNDSYNKNYIFDNINDSFNGVTNQFALQQSSSNITGITDENAIVLINDIFQVPSSDKDYTLSESSGITSVTFNGTSPQTPLGPDVGISSFPKGGVIVSVGSTEGFGYQPLVAAGGTAIVSSAGTITSVSIGNSGSGYRSGIQTNVSVGVKLPDVTGSTIIPVGIASISAGNITSVAITTDRVFYAPRSISNVGYNSITGLTTVTTSTAHGLSFGEEIIVSGIAFTCDYSGSGPVNVSNAIYDNISGIMTVTTSSAHNLSTTGQKSDVILTGLAFTCGLDGGSSTHVYPRTTDPAYCGSKVTSVPSTTVFVINVGVSTVPTFYQSGGVAQPALIAPRSSNNSASGFDPASQGSTVLKIIDSTNFEINTGISTRTHFYARCGTVKKPIDIVIDDPVSYSNMRLFYSSSSAAGVGTEATIDVVVGNGSSVIDFEIDNTGYGYRDGAILTVAIGGTTGIPTTSSYSGNEFQVTVDEIADDKFAGWSVGTLQVLDNIEDLIDGARKDFPLKLNGAITSIVSSPGSKIDVQDVLIIFVNDILQEPGAGYVFTGGSTLTFTEALKIGDIVTIIFYKGNGDSDVIFRDVIETVKKGDTLQLKHMAGSQAQSLDEDERSVLNILSTGNVATNPYFGPGNTNDVTLVRPVTWCRQTEDKIIDGIPTGKDRELYEPVINPTAYIIKNVGVGSTAIYVDSLRPLFNPQNEAANLQFQDKIKFVAQEPKVGASATAVISGFGTISSVVISDGGVGYSTATVSFGYTSASRAFGTVTISAGGTVTGVAITSPGVGYTYTSVPTVLISPPGHTEEACSVNTYSGDNGIIVGFGTTAGPKFIFDIHIPYDSFLRNTVVAGTAVTITSIQSNDYFMIKKSNVGMGNTFDGIYEVSSVETLERDVVGISTTVKRLFVDATVVPSGYSTGITTSDTGFGDFSWGRIDVSSRDLTSSYTAYTSGITTSTRVIRTNFLKSKNYTANS